MPAESQTILMLPVLLNPGCRSKEGIQAFKQLSIQWEQIELAALRAGQGSLVPVGACEPVSAAHTAAQHELHQYRAAFVCVSTQGCALQCHA